MNLRPFTLASAITLIGCSEPSDSGGGLAAILTPLQERAIPEPPIIDPTDCSTLVPQYPLTIERSPLAPSDLHDDSRKSAVIDGFITNDLAPRYLAFFQCRWKDPTSPDQGLTILEDTLTHLNPQGTYRALAPSVFFNFQTYSELNLPVPALKSEIRRLILSEHPALVMHQNVLASRTKDPRYEPRGKDVPESKTPIVYETFFYLRQDETHILRWPPGKAKDVRWWNETKGKWEKCPPKGAGL